MSEPIPDKATVDHSANVDPLHPDHQKSITIAVCVNAARFAFIFPVSNLQIPVAWYKKRQVVIILPR